LCTIMCIKPLLYYNIIYILFFRSAMVKPY